MFEDVKNTLNLPKFSITDKISVLYLVCLWHCHIAIGFDSHNIISSKFHCKIETLGFLGGKKHTLKVKKIWQ